MCRCRAQEPSRAPSHAVHSWTCSWWPMRCWPHTGTYRATGPNNPSCPQSAATPTCGGRTGRNRSPMRQCCLLGQHTNAQGSAKHTLPVNKGTQIHSEEASQANANKQYLRNALGNRPKGQSPGGLGAASPWSWPQQIPGHTGNLANLWNCSGIWMSATESQSSRKRCANQSLTQALHSVTCMRCPLDSIQRRSPTLTKYFKHNRQNYQSTCLYGRKP